MANAQFPGPPASSPTDGGEGKCPGCGHQVDPLRAGHVAILEGRFSYFCQAECKQSYLRTQGRPPEEHVVTARPPAVSYANGGTANGHAAIPIRAMPPLVPDGSSPAPLPRPLEPAPLASPASSRKSFRSSLAPPWRQPDAFVAIDVSGVVCGLLAPAIGLLGPVIDWARLPLILAAWAALLARVALAARDAADPQPLVVLVPTGGAVVAACWASVIHAPHATSLAVFAGLSCAQAIVIEMVVERARRRVRAAREDIERALDVRVHVLHGDSKSDLPASDVRPGEQIVVEPGEVVGVDATVAAGEARVVPWLGAKVEIVRREGDPVLAGARVVSNSLRMTTTWSGRDRAWVRLLSSRATRIDVASPTARAVRHTVERGAPLAAVVVGVASFAANVPPVEILASACAGAMAFAARAASAFVALHFSRAHLEALACGITYKDARAFERAASANLVVLSARGTVLLGEPEIVAIESVGALEVERVLSLAAGAETATNHPFAAAVLSAAKMRGVRPDHMRNATGYAGLGITAVAPSGERLVVGGRAIMLEQKIGVAMIEARVSELEAQGRSILLVALGDRLVGMIALQDGLRPGARAAVQKLLDARIEPVLLSGDARETCEAIGRALDIEHVRPEVLPADRGAEVRSLAEAGIVVAVIGHSAGDDGALGAADVAVAMGAAGSTAGEWAVLVASDDVRDAALALAIPHASRDRARIAIALGATPGLFALLAIALGVAPFALAPIAALLGAVAVAVHAREERRPPHRG
jgi:Cu+-exporting ATPase